LKKSLTASVHRLPEYSVNILNPPAYTICKNIKKDLIALEEKKKKDKDREEEKKKGDLDDFIFKGEYCKERSER